MSDALEALLGASLTDEKDVYIKRLDTDFKVQSISGEDLKEITAEASVKKGKKRETDEMKFGALIIAKSCLEPKFANADLLEKYGAISADEVVMKALRAGEISKLSTEIMDLSGFEGDEDAVEDVKN